MGFKCHTNAVTGGVAPSRPASSMTCTYRRIFMKLLVKIKACATVVTLVAACGLSTSPQEKAFNKAGNILISDQFNNHVIEVNPNTHKPISQFAYSSHPNRP